MSGCGLYRKRLVYIKEAEALCMHVGRLWSVCLDGKKKGAAAAAAM